MPRIGIPDIRGQFKFDSGTAATPSIGFRLDTDTGIYADTGNTLSFSTDGTRRMSILPDGSLEFVDISAPGVTTNKLYSVGGTLFWNGTDISTGGAITAVIDDTSPQLGGDLDVNDFNIIGKPAPSPTSAGGSINLISANGGATSGTGGDVVIKPGAGGGSSANGTIRIQDPAGSNFMNLGEFIFSGGFSSGYYGLTSPNGESAVLFSYGSGGGVFIKGQSGLATFPTSNDRGAIAIYSGYGADATYKSGTNINLVAGDAFNTTSASGGGIYLSSGRSGSSGNSGDIQLTAASARNGSTSGSGGSILLNAGTGGAFAPSAANGGTWTGSAGRGGPSGGGGGSWTGGSGISYSGFGASATLIAGANKGTSNGTGGAVSIQSGGSTSGAGGRIRLSSGYGSGVYNGGDIDLQTGVANGSGSTGNVRLFSNTASIPELQFVANGGITGNTIGFKAPTTITTSRSWVVPQDDPTTADGRFLTTDSSGVLGFSATVQNATVATTDNTTTTIISIPVSSGNTARVRAEWVAADSTNSEGGHGDVEAAAYNNAGTLGSIVGETVTNNGLATSGGTVSVNYNDTTDEIEIQVTGGVATTNINWSIVATIVTT